MMNAERGTMDAEGGMMHIPRSAFLTLAQEAQSRSALYNLLGRIFLFELTADELHRMRQVLAELSELHDLHTALMGDPSTSQRDVPFGSPSAPLRTGLGAGSAEPLEPPLADLENALRAAFTHTFLLNVYPHESVFYDGRLNTERTCRVLAAYRAQGYEPDLERTRARTHDHAGLELLFMALLAEKEVAAWQAGQGETARQLLSAELSFAREHLVTWIPLFAVAVREVCEHPFYTVASALLEQFIFEDHEYLTELWSRLDHGPGDDPTRRLSG